MIWINVYSIIMVSVWINLWNWLGYVAVQYRVALGYKLTYNTSRLPDRDT